MAKKPAASRSDDLIVDGDPALLQQLIQTMEGILEVFPEDVSALDSLSAAYSQAGEFEKSAAAGVKMARLLAAQGSLERAYGIVEQILEVTPENEIALAERENIVASLTALGIDLSDLTKAEENAKNRPPQDEDRDVLMLDLSGELELGWLLLQRGFLSQEQYESAIAGLTESRSNIGSSACLSLLIEVAAMDGVNLDNILGLLSLETTTPYIDLQKFELNPEAARMIPFDDARRLGVLPFAFFKDEVLIATLNPCDRNLRQAVATYLQTKCHFFLTSPDQFQSALMEVITMLEEEE